MQVLFSNPLIYVIDYPAEDAIELMDRRGGRMGLMTGEIAHRFRSDFVDLMAGKPEMDEFEDLIDHYSAVLTQSVVRH